MAKYNIFILNCITDLQKIYDTMFNEYCNGNIDEKQFESIKRNYERLMADLKHL